MCVLLLQVLQLSVFPPKICPGGQTGLQPHLDCPSHPANPLPTGLSETLEVGPDLVDGLQDEVREALGGHQVGVLLHPLELLGEVSHAELLLLVGVRPELLNVGHGLPPTQGDDGPFGLTWQKFRWELEQLRIFEVIKTFKEGLAEIRHAGGPHQRPLPPLPLPSDRGRLGLGQLLHDGGL